jgi:endonuclease-3
MKSRRSPEELGRNDITIGSRAAESNRFTVYAKGLGLGSMPRSAWNAKVPIATAYPLTVSFVCMDTRERMAAIHSILKRIYIDTKPLLAYSSPFQLLIAVMLSAQCTDEQVNKVTPRLFSEWPDAESLGRADYGKVEKVIHSVGFFRTKARHIVDAARIIGDAEVPRTIEGLTRLPGVGRKTANLVASAIYGVPGIIVDTHVLRVSRRLGLGESSDAQRVERDLARLMDAAVWTEVSHELNRLGKYICVARTPACEACPISSLCPSFGKYANGTNGKKKRRETG